MNRYFLNENNNKSRNNKNNNKSMNNKSLSNNGNLGFDNNKEGFIF